MDREKLLVEIKSEESENDIVVADDLPDHIIGMLTNMIKKLDKRF